MSAMVQAPTASDNIQSKYRLTPSGVVSKSKDIAHPLDRVRVPGLLAVGLVARGFDQFLQLVRLRKFQIDVLRRNRALEPFGVELVVEAGLHRFGQRIIDQ